MVVKLKNWKKYIATGSFLLFSACDVYWLMPAKTLEGEILQKKSIGEIVSNNSRYANNPNFEHLKKNTYQGYAVETSQGNYLIALKDCDLESDLDSKSGYHDSISKTIEFEIYQRYGTNGVDALRLHYFTDKPNRLMYNAMGETSDKFGFLNCDQIIKK